MAEKKKKATSKKSSSPLVEDLAKDIPPIKVQRRILELINDSRRPEDLVTRFRIDRGEASKILKHRHFASDCKS